MSLRTRWQGLSTKAKTATTGVVASGAILAGAVAGPAACEEPGTPPISEIPAAAQGAAYQTWTQPDATPFRSDGGAAERVTCRRSHFNYSDGITAPGQPFATHLHMYFGATGVNYQTESPEDRPSSTCEGGTSNRTAYWMPAMIRADGTVKDAAPYENAIQVYYKQGYRGVAEELIEPFPNGLKMIVGDHRATSPQPGNRIWWTCEGSRHLTQGSGTPTIPRCPPGSFVVANGEFPQCWDGRNLDSPSHGRPAVGGNPDPGETHMAYGKGWRSDPSPPESGCPEGFDHALPQITQHVLFEVLPGEDPTTWRLSSDPEGGRPGMTLHFDWWEGWDEQIMSDIVNLCLRPSLDCRQGLIPYPDGTRKLGPAQG